MADLITKQDGAILHITLNQPERGNTVSDEMVIELTRLVGEASKNSEIVILRGAGADFCRGRASMGSRAPGNPEAYARRKMNDVVFDCYGALRNSTIPVIGVVQGRAAGFGCAIAAACDITIAADSALFQVPEMEHNILPTMVMSSFVDRVPRKALSYLVYSTAEISAERALSFGIVSEIAPVAKLDDTVSALCTAILRAPPIATRGVKEFMKVAPDMPIQGAVDFSRNFHALINSSSEIRGKK